MAFRILSFSADLFCRTKNFEKRRRRAIAVSMVSVLLKAFQGPRHPIPLPFAVDQVVDEPQKINGDLPVNKNQKWSVHEYI